MKAFRIREPGATEVVDLPKPVPAEGEVLLRVRKVGFCGSDLSTYKGGNPLVSYPRIPGHEIAATVEAVTAGAPDRIQPGVDVTVIPYTNCGTCSSGGLPRWCGERLITSSCSARGCRRRG